MTYSLPTDFFIDSTYNHLVYRLDFISFWVDLEKAIIIKL